MKGLKPFVLLLTIVLTSCSSLIGDLFIPDGWGVDYYTVNCRDIYKITGSSIGYNANERKYYLEPQFTTDKRLSLEGINYYYSLDTVLHHTVVTRGAEPVPDLVAFDWRISKMEAITLVELDKTHPVNSTVSDLIYLRTNYANYRDSIKLSEIRFGDVMLQWHYTHKYFPEEKKRVGLTGESFVLEPTGTPTVDLHNIEIHIYTAFGDHFIARSETKEQEENEKGNSNII